MAEKYTEYFIVQDNKLSFRTIQETEFFARVRRLISRGKIKDIMAIIGQNVTAETEIAADSSVILFHRAGLIFGRYVMEKIFDKDEQKILNEQLSLVAPEHREPYYLFVRGEIYWDLSEVVKLKIA